MIQDTTLVESKDRGNIISQATTLVVAKRAKEKVGL